MRRNPSSESEKNPIKNRRRIARRRAQFPPGATCARCGLMNLELLVKGSLVPISLLEGHHPFGAAHHPLLGPFCLNCHRIVSAAQLNEGAQLQPAGSFLEQLARALLSLGSFLAEIGKALIAWARELLRRFAQSPPSGPPWSGPWFPQ
jgi:hypothetical protein